MADTMVSSPVMLSSHPRRPSSPLIVDPTHRGSTISSRSSAISSSASFRTAPIATPSQSSASSSRQSLDTLSPEPAVNPMHALSAALQQGSHHEFHILKVATEKVQVEATPASFKKLAGSQSRQKADGDSRAGPLPSPPASIYEDNEQQPKFFDSPSEIEPPVVYEEPEPIIRGRISSSSSTTTARIAPVRAATTDFNAGTSADRKTSFSSTIRNAQPRPVEADLDPQLQADVIPPLQGSPKPSDFLQPPPPMNGPSRRNTTGSSFGARLIGGTKGTRGSLHSQFSSHPNGAYDDSTELDDMASDIQLQAEKIRRERIEKRAKQQAEAEAALTAKKDENVPLVGNLIGEDHANYILMYNMLTGIRIGVSRCQAKIKRPLTDEDFSARHKFSFDIVGNELTPSAKYDFKFKDYAPWVFRALREDHFHLDPADYLLSLTSKYILSELGSPGKSGSFFYFSRDYRFIIKTIHHSEHKFLLKVLKDYYNHVKENPHTLLSRFYGLHRVKLPRGRKIHFVIMNNLFPAHKDIHETYDLKGSTVGREFPEGTDKQNPVLKDMNWINRHKTLELGPEKRALLTEQLRRDKELLKKIHVMDYSLLVGIHNMQRGNRDNVRRNTLKVFDPTIQQRRSALPGTSKPKPVRVGTTSPEAIAIRRAMRESDPKRLGKGTFRLPEQDTGDRDHFIFYQDEGGLQATDEANEGLDTVYYLGVIDILTPYTGLKKLEHLWKGLSADRHKISPVPPAEYSDRFFAFMQAVMRGGGGGDSFKP